MATFESKRLYDPNFTHENRLPPRASIVPSLQRGVFFKNKSLSELILDLNGDYKFAYRASDDLGDFYKTDYDDSRWNTLLVPSMWQYHGYSQPLYPNVEYPIPFVPPYVGNSNPVGYYRKSFAATSGGRRILYFGGVDSAFFVYLNGEYVGFSKGSRMPAEFDVTHLIKDGENLLCVKVFTYCDGTYLENQDMLLASGIFRDVMLYSLGEVSVWDYQVRTQNDLVLVDVTLAGSTTDTVSVKASIGKSTKLLSGEKESSFTFNIPEPKRWNAEEPYTYELVIELTDNGKLLEMHTKRFGFANYYTEGNKIMLNGSPITLKGINRHEHDPKNGRAVTVELIEKELRLIKEHNFNTIRCAHYPNNPAFYEICTELGIYVINEADIETHGAYKCGDMGYFSKHPGWFKAYMDRVGRMYERDKNETCIAIWTTGNENGNGENIHKCVDYLKSRSVKKPVMHTGDAREPVKSDFRAFGYHTMADLSSFSEEGKPVMMLEYGHAMGNSPGLMEDTWDYVYKHRHICGGSVWEFKCHGFYSEDEKGNAFYKYGGDFGDYNHWSNFSMDGYCLSDGTPKPSLRECKNVLAPTYVELKDQRVLLTNTNDFRPLDYISLKWEIKEDHQVISSAEQKLPPIAPYQSAYLDIDTRIPSPVPGAKYFVDLHFYGEDKKELAFKQLSLGVKQEKELFTPQIAPLMITRQGDEVCIKASDTKITITNGLLSYLEKGEKVLLKEPMRLNLYRAPIDNDGIVNWNERWITEWNKYLYRYFEFIHLSTSITEKENGSALIRVKGKWAPISKFTGFDIQLTYTVFPDGNILVDIHGTPYGKFADTVPRIGLVFTLEKEFKDVLWYGRGEDECYVDRRAHCPVGLYSSTVDKMNFIYDVPQECGTRIDTYFLKIGNSSPLGFVGADSFSFSYHDFSLDDLIAARHRNELKKSDKNYLYLDYAMRGLGSRSCGPDPEECHELRAHEFRFVFMICPDPCEEKLLELSRQSFGAVSERLGPTHKFDPKTQHANVVECIRE